MAGTCSWSAMLVATTTYADLTGFSLGNVIAVSSSGASANIAFVCLCSPVFFCLRYIDIRIVAMSEVSVIAVWSCSANSNA